MATVTVAKGFSFDQNLLNFNNLLWAQSYATTSGYFAAWYSNNYVDGFFGTGFRYDSYGFPVAGTVKSYEASIGSTFLFSVSGISLRAVDLVAATLTANTSDDRALISKALSGADKFSGGNQKDVFNAYAGADTMRGNGGNDVLKGGSGADTLYGGRGADYLSGGADADRFVFNTKVLAAERDRISDFGSGDKILLENAVFTGLVGVGAAKTLASGAFQLGSVAKQSDDRILYNKTTGEVFFDQDGSKALHKPILFADLLNNASLNAASFVII